MHSSDSLTSIRGPAIGKTQMCRAVVFNNNVSSADNLDKQPRADPREKITRRNRDTYTRYTPPSRPL